MKFLLEIRGHIDRTESHAVPTEVVKMAIQGATTFVAKAQNHPDITAVHDTLRTMRGDAKAAKEETSQRLEALKKELQSTNTQIEKIAAVGGSRRKQRKRQREWEK